MWVKLTCCGSGSVLLSGADSSVWFLKQLPPVCRSGGKICQCSVERHAGKMCQRLSCVYSVKTHEMNRPVSVTLINSFIDFFYNQRIISLTSECNLGKLFTFCIVTKQETPHRKDLLLLSVCHSIVVNVCLHCWSVSSLQMSPLALRTFFSMFWHFIDQTDQSWHNQYRK